MVIASPAPAGRGNPKHLVAKGLRLPSAFGGPSEDLRRVRNDAGWGGVFLLRKCHSGVFQIPLFAAIHHVGLRPILNISGCKQTV